MEELKLPSQSVKSGEAGRGGGGEVEGMIILWNPTFFILMVSVLDSGSNGPGSGPGRGHCVVFLGKKLYSHSASLHPGV